MRAGRCGSEGRRTRMTLIIDAGVPATAAELCERLGQVSAELSALTQSAFASFGHDEAAAVAAGVERVTRGVEALQHQCAGGIESGKAWTETGYRSFSRWWSVHTHRRQHTSNAIRLLARDLRDRLPLTAAALQAERLGVEHARVLAAYTKTEAQREQLLLRMSSLPPSVVLMHSCSCAGPTWMPARCSPVRGCGPTSPSLSTWRLLSGL